MNQASLPSLRRYFVHVEQPLILAVSTGWRLTACSVVAIRLVCCVSLTWERTGARAGRCQPLWQVDQGFVVLTASSVGWLIHATVGSFGGAGGLGTNRSGWAARPPQAPWRARPGPTRRRR